MPSQILRKIPSVSELLENPQIRTLVDRVSHNVVTDRIRVVLDEVREEVTTSATDISMPDISELASRVARRVVQGEQPKLRPAINATGILLHTGLGRAPLAEKAIEEVVAAARGYCSLEIDLDSGQRSQRMDAVTGLLTELTGAQAALVANNNAAATMLSLAALAEGREVIVSRGQLVEIGGSYRLPEVMKASGAILREVGATNRTRLSDYEQAIGDETAALMRVHPSNYVIQGFTESVAIDDLASLGQKSNLPVIDDIGSGALDDLSELGLSDEPIVRQSLKSGADVVLFSGDKLLGGPQCGIAVGRADLIEKMRKHPMMRAMRVDKMTLAALGATLRLHRDETTAREQIPVMRLASTSVENLQNRAERLAPQIQATAAIDQAEPIQDIAYFGGGSIPQQEMATWAIAVKPARGSADRLATALRCGAIALVPRIQKDRVLIDLRSIFPHEESQVLACFQALDAHLSDPAEE